MDIQKSVGIYLTWEKYEDLIMDTVYKNRENKDDIRYYLKYRIGEEYFRFTPYNDELKALAVNLNMEFIQTFANNEGIYLVIKGPEEEPSE